MRIITPLFYFIVAVFAHGALQANESSATFQLLALSLNEGTIAVAKCNRQTGEAWFKEGTKWTKGVDASSLPASTYHCKAKAFKEKGWLLIRIDTKSGDTWTLEGTSWKKVEH